MFFVIVLRILFVCIIASTTTEYNHSLAEFQIYTSILQLEMSRIELRLLYAIAYCLEIEKRITNTEKFVQKTHEIDKGMEDWYFAT